MTDWHACIRAQQPAAYPAAAARVLRAGARGAPPPGAREALRAPPPARPRPRAFSKRPRGPGPRVAGRCDRGALCDRAGHARLCGPGGAPLDLGPRGPARRGPGQ
eukprot:1357007-Rhodomonas_salina.3